ncbi:hypothetical protein [Maridesulfovibrio ferrireducens]|uniref:hypothetical protein n=1 Tax=Maridesulfovibrio ferrireducens TaxID=246191 RepID=UPI001A32E207|nr:hypothetical protein [Maridesulfovibrio ferrireducens]MBI9112255.1 hypothetical protein [Maridesulfovibrio ferrireducens]
MIPIATILGFFTGSGKGKIIAIVVGVLILTIVIGGLCFKISWLKTDIAILEKDKAELNEDIAGFKLEIRTGETAITLLKESGNQTTRVIASLQGQLSTVQKSAKKYRIQHAKAVRLFNSARNHPITNSTGVISYEDSRNAAEFINHTLGMQPEASQ